LRRENAYTVTFAPFGLRLTRLKSTATHGFGIEVLFEVLRQFSFSPKRIVDVGANHGFWTGTALKFFPEARYTLLEPQDWSKMIFKTCSQRGETFVG